MLPAEKRTTEVLRPPPVVLTMNLFLWKGEHGYYSLYSMEYVPGDTSCRPFESSPAAIAPEEPRLQAAVNPERGTVFTHADVMQLLERTIEQPKGPLPILPYPFSLGNPMKMGSKRRVKLKQMLRQQCPHCCLCGKYIGKGAGELDHIVPKSRGGMDHECNLRLCCVNCNRTKSQMTLVEYLPIVMRTAARVFELVEGGVA